jgi:hypothetical protein
MKNEAMYSDLYHKAHSAGMAALVTTVPTPMVVVEANWDGSEKQDGQRFFESDGMCGFAWIEVLPGNCSFANWLKKAGKGRKGYPSGVHIWVREGGQSIERKERYAQAFAEVLKAANLPGVSVYPNSRLD